MLSSRLLREQLPSTSCTSRLACRRADTSPAGQCGTGAGPGGRSTAAGGWTDTAETPAVWPPGDTEQGAGEAGRCKHNTVMTMSRDNTLMSPALLPGHTPTLLPGHGGALLSGHIPALLLGRLSLHLLALLPRDLETALGGNSPGHALTLLPRHLGALLARHVAANLQF